MRCVMCGSATLPPTLEERPLHFGLEGARIAGARVHRCPACGEEFEELPPAEELLDALTAQVAELGRPLRGEEIRFLRKRLGWAQKDFAESFCVDKTTVSKWENDRVRMDAFKDKMLRMLAVRGPLLEDYGHDTDPEQPAPFRVFVPSFEPDPGPADTGSAVRKTQAR